VSGAAWVIATDTKYLVSMVTAGAALGAAPTVVAVGPRDLAEAAAESGAGQVVWLEPTAGTPAEAYGPAVAALVTAAGPRLLLASSAAAARTLLGAAAAALGAATVSGAIAVEASGDKVAVKCSRLGGAVVETFEAAGPVAAVCQGYDAPAPGGAAPIESADLGQPAALTIADEHPAPGGGGLTEAERVVGFGRGIKVRADMAMVEELAAALNAAVGCTMPVADDYKWMDQYIGRSGLSIAPKLYLALGIQGSPQHTQGIRDVKVVAAINTDPEAPIFRRATYGIVADLYEVVPEILAALKS
jgi:electron transfer flavoprotein alpha subunit